MQRNASAASPSKLLIKYRPLRIILAADTLSFGFDHHPELL
jgi:hypothetical protein